MKKTRKLTLKKETIKLLTGPSLARVNGGGYDRVIGNSILYDADCVVIVNNKPIVIDGDSGGANACIPTHLNYLDKIKVIQLLY